VNYSQFPFYCSIFLTGLCNPSKPSLHTTTLILSLPLPQRKQVAGAWSRSLDPHIVVLAWSPCLFELFILLYRLTTCICMLRCIPTYSHCELSWRTPFVLFSQHMLHRLWWTDRFSYLCELVNRLYNMYLRSALLGCYSLLIGCYWSFRTALKMGPTGCPETSVTNYQSTLSNIAEGRRRRWHRGRKPEIRHICKRCSPVRLWPSRYFSWEIRPWKIILSSLIQASCSFLFNDAFYSSDYVPVVSVRNKASE